MNFIELGEGINSAGREFKAWFTEFTLVYSPILIVAGLILTGMDLFLNLGIGNSLWFKLPWSIAQLFAVDGLWFAVWNRILTDDYRWGQWPYHLFIVALGLALTGIAIVMNFVIFTQDYMGLRDAVAAMNFIGIPVGLFLLVRSVLLMLTATFAIILDKVMRSKAKSNRKSNPIKPIIPAASTTVSEDVHTQLALPAPVPGSSKREAAKQVFAKFIAEGKTDYTYQDVADLAHVSLQTVKLHARKIKEELKHMQQE